MTTTTAPAANTASTTPATTSTSTTGATATEGAANANAQAKAAAAGEATYEAVVNGKKVQVPVKALIERYQKEESVDTRFRQVAEKEKAALAKEQQIETLLQNIKKNGGAGLKEAAKFLGVDVRAIIEAEMAEDIKKQLMTPEQRELAEYKAKVQAIEEEKKLQAKAAQEAKAKAYAEEVANKIKTEIGEALSKVSLPKDDANIGRMAFYMDQARKAKVPLTWEQAANQVKIDYVNQIKHLVTEIPEEQLVEMFGPDALKKLNKAIINQAKGIKTPSAAEKAINNSSDSKPRQSKKKYNPLEWRENLEKKLNSQP